MTKWSAVVVALAASCAKPAAFPTPGREPALPPGVETWVALTDAGDRCSVMATPRPARCALFLGYENRIRSPDGAVVMISNQDGFASLGCGEAATYCGRRYECRCPTGDGGSESAGSPLLDDE